MISGAGAALSSEGDEQDSASDDDDDDPATYTEEQVSACRFVLIKEALATALDSMGDLVLGEQADSPVMMFNTSFSYDVMDSITVVLELSRLCKNNWSQKFNTLFAYTFTIKQYDAWIYDNEGLPQDFFTSLGKEWSKILSKTDLELGIDSEFTRPAVVEFLSKFKEEVEECQSEEGENIEFEY